FFASMRSDIPAAPEAVSPEVTGLTSDTPTSEAAPEAAVLTPEQLAAYIHGSAEVVGEMCVLAFFDGDPLPPDADERLLPGARALGSAFQKVNFIRDIAHDSSRLRRGYLVAPGHAHAGFTEAERDRLTNEVFAEL